MELTVLTVPDAPSVPELRRALIQAGLARTSRSVQIVLLTMCYCGPTPLRRADSALIAVLSAARGVRRDRGVGIRSEAAGA
jgi:hypothetical protein